MLWTLVSFVIERISSVSPALGSWLWPVKNHFLGLHFSYNTIGSQISSVVGAGHDGTQPDGSHTRPLTGRLGE